MSGVDAATAAVDATYDGIVVRLRHSIAVANFTVTVLLSAVSRLLYRRFQHTAAAAAVSASATVRAGVTGMRYLLIAFMHANKHIESQIICRHLLVVPHH